MYNFVLAGAAGFVAPRHFEAMKSTCNNLLAVLDPHDAVGILDKYFPEAYYFSETELFERFINSIQSTADSENERIHYFTICSPNYLHDSHINIALHAGINAICEKPLTIDPKNIYKILELEEKSGKRVYPVLQLRLHPNLLELRNTLKESKKNEHYKVRLTYITRRGNWYHSSWKGSFEKSGGIAMNIGVHFFDVLIWLFGSVQKSILHLSQPNKMAGVLELDNASVQWFLSIDNEDLPQEIRDKGNYALRTLLFNGEIIDFSDKFTDLHTRVYEEILAGRGVRVSDTEPSLNLVNMINKSEISPVTNSNSVHPLLLKNT